MCSNGPEAKAIWKCYNGHKAKAVPGMISGHASKKKSFSLDRTFLVQRVLLVAYSMPNHNSLKFV